MDFPTLMEQRLDDGAPDSSAAARDQSDLLLVGSHGGDTLAAAMRESDGTAASNP
jgi:hypothetical protein